MKVVLSIVVSSVADSVLNFDHGRLQYGALPYRFTPGGAVEFLLVTSRRTRRWIIPKGWPVKGLGPAGSAAREAFEEAGVVGKISRRAVGSFQYCKRLKDGTGSVNCNVVVFPLRVDRELTTWPEATQRDLRWLDTDGAIELISDSGLRGVIKTAADRVGGSRG